MNKKLSPLVLLRNKDTLEMDIKAENIFPGISKELMKNAGIMSGRIICQHYAARKTVVICGPGNNGGDGYVLAQYLLRKGWPVCIMQISSPKTRLAQDNFNQYNGEIINFTKENIKDFDLVIDAGFGSGLSRNISDNISAIMTSAKHIIALDVPTGLDSDTGKLKGNVACCEMTIAFIKKRPGHLLFPGCDKCGKVIVIDIGMPKKIEESILSNIWENDPYLWCTPRQRKSDNKYSRGVVSLVSGCVMPGASLLALQSARHAGAGLVTIMSTQAMAFFYQAQAPGAIIDTSPLHEQISDKRRKVWICGPGLLAEEVEATLPILINNKNFIIADAGVFSWAKSDPNKLLGVAIITPHIGEFERVFGKITDSKIEAASKAAKIINAVVVLKGYDTIIASPSGKIAINVHAHADLATAGSGDILTGIIGTFLAAGMDVWEAACAGAWVHGEAGILAALEYGKWPVSEQILMKASLARQNTER